MKTKTKIAWPAGGSGKRSDPWFYLKFGMYGMLFPTERRVDRAIQMIKEAMDREQKKGWIGKWKVGRGLWTLVWRSRRPANGKLRAEK